MRSINNYPMKNWVLDPSTICYRGRYIRNWFSNMDSCCIHSKDDGIVYPSVENYFQAHKVLDVDIRKQVSKMDSFTAKRWAKTIKPHTDWNDGLDVMYEALYLKWSQPHWSSLLFRYQNDIVEWNNWNDSKWGVPIRSISGELVPQQGRNILGCLLMEVREELSRSTYDISYGTNA